MAEKPPKSKGALSPPPAVIEPGDTQQRRDVITLLQTVLKMAVEMVNADRGVIFLKEDDGVRSVAAHNLPPEGPTSLSEVSSSAVRQVLESGTPVLTHDAQADPRFEEAASVILHQITSIFCVPMFLEDQVIGVIYLDSRSDRTHFNEEALNFVSTFGKMAAIAVDYAYGYQKVLKEKQLLQSEAEGRWTFDEIVGKSARMQEVFDLMRRVMNSDISVMLEGESGTGKELVARALHYNGPRRDRPFVAQFCGNLAESLLESELFGHKKGSFTGAVADKKGLFEIADGGTFFLDEIADISPTIQTKLLRVIQEGEIRRVGDTESRKVDVRIISATNKSLRAEVQAGKFREDLYYRLNVITIRLPALQERIGDIPLLVQHFLKRFAAKNNVPIKKVSAAAMQALNNYHWPGNVRELENTIERAMILSQGDAIKVSDLFIPEADSPPGKRHTLKEFEKEHVLRVLKQCDNNKTRTAELLGVSLRWLHYKLSEWNKRSS